jgi:FHA domain
VPKMILSIDGVVIREVQLVKDKVAVGRRPYNDIVIDSLAVSGEHAMVHLMDDQAHIEDLNSTNGTYVNGRAVKKQQLQHEDTIGVGKYTLQFLQDLQAGSRQTAQANARAQSAANDAPRAEARSMALSMADMQLTAPAALDATTYVHPKAQASRPGVAPADTAVVSAPAPLQYAQGAYGAFIRVVSGSVPREVELLKVVTTIGKTGVAVAAITRRQQAYVLSHVEGALKPALNGSVIAGDPITLRNGDLVELAGIQLQFVQR